MGGILKLPPTSGATFLGIQLSCWAVIGNIQFRAGVRAPGAPTLHYSRYVDEWLNSLAGRVSCGKLQCYLRIVPRGVGLGVGSRCGRRCLWLSISWTGLVAEGGRLRLGNVRKPGYSPGRLRFTDSHDVSSAIVGMGLTYNARVSAFHRYRSL